MINIFLAPGLRRLCGGVARTAVDAGDVGSALDALFRQHPPLAEMLSPPLAATSSVRVFHGAVDVTAPEQAARALSPGDELMLVHAVAGG